MNSCRCHFQFFTITERIMLNDTKRNVQNQKRKFVVSVIKSYFWHIYFFVFPLALLLLELFASQAKPLHNHKNRCTKTTHNITALSLLLGAFNDKNGEPRNDMTHHNSSKYFKSHRPRICEFTMTAHA